MRTRFLVKAVSWEVISNLVCFGLALLIFGNIGSCLVFTSVCVLIKLGLFYYHEKIWSERRPAVKYRIVKWWPDLPGTKQPATQQLFTDRNSAEIFKDEMKAIMPHRRFAVEPIQPEETTR